jgi:hypothetical protein
MNYSDPRLDVVSSIEDVEKLLDNLLLREQQVDAQLEQLLEASAQPDLTALEQIQSSLYIEDQISQLWDKIGHTAETASGLSERVKRLDLEQARVKECLKYVEDVQELKV